MPEEKPPQQPNPSVFDQLKTEYEQFTENDRDVEPIYKYEVPSEDDEGPVALASGASVEEQTRWRQRRRLASKVNLAEPAPASKVEEAPPAATQAEVPTESQEEEEPAFGSVLTANVRDQPTDEDSLGFGPYVEAIAAFLTNKVTTPPLTLSIEGEWGSGKSSFMMQLEAELRKVDSRIVRFNAWRYDKDDAMWATFALKFARDLSQQLTWRERWLAHLKLFMRRFDWQDGWKDVTRLVLMISLLVTILALPILMRDRIEQFFFPPPPAASAPNKPTESTPAAATSEPKKSDESKLEKALKPLIGAGGGLAYLALVISLFASLKDVVGNPLKVNLKHHLNAPDYKSRVAFIERFHEDFGKVAEVYGKGEKIFVFVDDLDRCEIPRAADLMQGINLMISDSSQLIFIMGMDREKVAAGLAVKYEKLLPYLTPPRKTSNGQPAKEFDPVFGLEYGYSFIEKFIQLPFLVPQASVDQVTSFLGKLSGPKTVPAEPATVNATTTTQKVAAPWAESKVTDDSQFVGDILKMVAPAFEYNPRRLKQFVNAFRLKTFIASRTGLFDKPTDPANYDRLTHHQLGKFVAIGLRWPLLLADLDNHRNLFELLESRIIFSADPTALLAKLEDKDELADVVERWYSRPALRALLRFGYEPETLRTHTLSRTNINKLLQISPRPTTLSRVAADAPPQAAAPPAESISSNGNEGPKVGIKS